VTYNKHGCNKRFCDYCKQKKELGHLCYKWPLKDALLSACDKILYVFYDFVPTESTRYTDDSKLHAPNLVCLQQFCPRCEEVEDGVDCVRWGRRKHSFWQDPVWDLLIYLTEPRPWAKTSSP